SGAELNIAPSTVVTSIPFFERGWSFAATALKPRWYVKLLMRMITVLIQTGIGSEKGCHSCTPLVAITTYAAMSPLKVIVTTTSRKPVRMRDLLGTKRCG